MGNYTHSLVIRPRFRAHPCDIIMKFGPTPCHIIMKGGPPMSHYQGILSQGHKPYAIELERKKKKKKVYSSEYD